LWPGGKSPQILPRPPKFLDTVVLLLVELIGSIVISFKFRLAVVVSQMMRGQAPQIFFPRTAPDWPGNHTTVFFHRYACWRKIDVFGPGRRVPKRYSAGVVLVVVGISSLKSLRLS